MFRRILREVVSRSSSSSLRWIQSESKPFPDVLTGLSLRTTSYQYLEVGKRVVEAYSCGNGETKKDVLLSIATMCGPDRLALANAISLYNKNPSLAHEVREAATPVHFRLLQSIGNLPDGIKRICDMRAHLLFLMKTERDRSVSSSLRRLEESAHELLVLWFCQSNMKLERLTWQSPGDILHKVSEYEAVHPVRGPADFKKRLGHGRRCFYFSHEAMPREPLVVVHVALLDKIANSVQSIVDCEEFDRREDSCTTAIYYSITATQPGTFFVSFGYAFPRLYWKVLAYDLAFWRDKYTYGVTTFEPYTHRRLYAEKQVGSFRSLLLTTAFGILW